jgi:hypothetical protein
LLVCSSESSKLSCLSSNISNSEVRASMFYYNKCELVSVESDLSTPSICTLIIYDVYVIPRPLLYYVICVFLITKNNVMLCKYDSLCYSMSPFASHKL